MKSLFLTLAGLFLSSSTFSQSPQKIVKSLLYDEYGIKAQCPGVGISIGIIKGDAVYYYASGNRSKDDKRPIDEYTLFEIGSLTKPFTGILLAADIRDKIIGSEDDMDSYLPTTVTLKPGLQHKVKMTDLVSHQSGLPNLSNDHYIGALAQKDPTNPFQSADKVYILDILNKTDSLKNYKNYQYNNYTYALLGILLEKIHRESYAELLQKTILTPLKMKHTGLTIRNSETNRAGLYDEDGQPQEKIILNAVAPAGGLHSNTIDLVTFTKAQLINREDPLGKAFQIAQQVYYNSPKQKTGLGWEITDQYFEKGGDTFGNSSLIRFDKKNQIGIVLLSNHQDADLLQYIADYLYQHLLPDQKTKN